MQCSSVVVVSKRSREVRVRCRVVRKRSNARIISVGKLPTHTTFTSRIWNWKWNDPIYRFRSTAKITYVGTDDGDPKIDCTASRSYYQPERKE